MKFAIITHVPHIFQDQKLYAYGPYVREMNLWIKNVDSVLIVAPFSDEQINPIDSAYSHKNIKMINVSSFDVKSLGSKIQTVFKLPKIIFAVFKAMKQADHIHLRCPGNMGLLGCIVQLLFPNKPKTAKYAGNWDPKARMPFSYKMQRWLLNNSLLTKNMQVLVYGEWPNPTKNIKPFFTATYTEKEKKPIVERELNGTIELLFVGTLSKGKRPLYAVQLAEKLFERGLDVQLKLYGEGIERELIEDYISIHNLDSLVTLMGNRDKDEIQQAYEQSNFLILPSQSEGWPKVVAEAMFWGCIPVASQVSCVANMLKNGERGLLLEMNLEKDTVMIEHLINDPNQYRAKQHKAVLWSRNYTLDYFVTEIEKLLKPCE